MSGMFLVGSLVAIVRPADNKVLATATVDKVTDREIRTETPYQQLENPRYDLRRRYWRYDEPHKEMRIPREKKDTYVPCLIRLATDEDVVRALHRAAARDAKKRMPGNLRNKEEFERQIANTEEYLQHQRVPYERLLEAIKKDEALIASGDD